MVKLKFKTSVVFWEINGFCPDLKSFVIHKYFQ